MTKNLEKQMQFDFANEPKKSNRKILENLGVLAGTILGTAAVFTAVVGYKNQEPKHYIAPTKREVVTNPVKPAEYVPISVKPAEYVPAPIKKSKPKPDYNPKTTNQNFAQKTINENPKDLKHATDKTIAGLMILYALDKWSGMNLTDSLVDPILKKALPYAPTPSNDSENQTNYESKPQIKRKQIKIVPAEIIILSPKDYEELTKKQWGTK